MQQLSGLLLKKLQGYDTPTICNLIEMFEVRPHNTGYMDSRVKACFTDLPPMVGLAATATFRAAAPAQGLGGYDQLQLQVERFGELSGPAVVVFQDLDDPPIAATFGEIMCSIYQALGSTGLITSGAGRDLDQIHPKKYPLFTCGAICSHGYNRIPDVHVPVRVGGLVVYPDDLLHGDLNGVTTIPKEIVSELLDIADEFVAAERVVLDAVSVGNLSLAILREARAEQIARIQKLRAQVSRRRG
jgi:4-hydroxy-4-methyl-2-oxoglutarate aldolase